MASQLCPLVEGWLEVFVGELHLTRFADVGGDCVPHVGDENNVL